MSMMRALAWAASGDTGVSSCAILAATIGEPAPDRWSSYPRDTGDLGRCLRLLAAWPTARIGIRRLAKSCAVWKAIDEDWTRIARAARREGVAEKRSMFGRSEHARTAALLQAAIARGSAEGVAAQVDDAKSREAI